MDRQMPKPTEQLFRGHGIFGWDASDEKFTWY